jgi:peptidoglycan/xylan/chitin deacetylase (PgdA/CDA1 family)
MLKRIINLSISIAVGAGDWLSNQFRRLLGPKPCGTCVVLAYHSVTPEQRPQFASQLDMLLRFAKPIRADVEVPTDDGGRHAAITFDDGLQSVVDNALPELKKRGIPTTLFIVTEALGGPPCWQHFESVNPASQEVVMTEQQLRELPSDLVAIGSHTMTHPKLPSLDDNQLRQEILGSRTKLEKMLGREVKLFSFPYGASDARVVEKCREGGYNRVFTALPILAFTEPKEFITGRVRIEPTDWPIEFRLKLAGAYRWLPSAYIWKRRILAPFRGAGTPQLGVKAGAKGAA